MKLLLLAMQAFAFAFARALQVPLVQNPLPANQESAWDLNVPLPVDTTSHLIFDTVASLLQHWPNTRYRNGHNFVPGYVPPGTLLYHGRPNNEVPSIPEWVATDPEHSLLFCRQECWHLTLVTTRPLKVLYFDGSSAAKMLNGSMDSQDILLWGAAKPEFVFAERLRIAELCEWGREYGVDGYVRMEMDFEIMLCDFSSGVETSSFLNLISQHDRPDRQSAYEVLLAGSWHNNYPGETRIVLDLSRIVSGYDTSLFPSLIKHRRGQERWQHRLDGMSETEVATLQSKLSEFLRGDINPSMHRIDWATLIKTIYNRYSDRLPVVQYLINNATNSGYTLDSAQKIQSQLRTMLSPYILGDVVPDTSKNLSWASPIYRECSVSHTAYIKRAKSTFTPSEQTILLSVEETSREICRVITRMWADGIAARVYKAEDSYTPDLRTLVVNWRDALDGLMHWLDWSVWVQCNPACSFEEFCYLPTWPFFRWPGRPRPRPPLHHPAIGDFGDYSSFEEEWVIPKPKCVRRMEPYDDHL